MKKEKAYVLNRFDSGMHYILLDKMTTRLLTAHDNKRAICCINHEVEFHCAVMPKKEGGHFVNVGSAICKKLKIKEGSTIRASFWVDTSAYQFEMPEALQAVFDTDPEASDLFDALSPGNQRSIMYLASKAKSTDKRIEKALKIAAQLKSGITSPRDMKV
jgi:hypothetical protein